MCVAKHPQRQNDPGQAPTWEEGHGLSSPLSSSVHLTSFLYGSSGPTPPPPKARNPNSILPEFAHAGLCAPLCGCWRGAVVSLRRRGRWTPAWRTFTTSEPQFFADELADGGDGMRSRKKKAEHFAPVCRRRRCDVLWLHSYRGHRRRHLRHHFPRIDDVVAPSRRRASLQLWKNDPRA